MHAPAALRVHPLESYALILNTLPLFALGFPLDALAAVAPISFLYALFIHSDLSIGVRRLVWVVNSPAYHRWHHSREYRGDGSNFAGFFPVFDVLFGSYYFPKEPPKSLGIDDENMPKTYAAQMAYPLRRSAQSVEPTLTLAAEKHAELQ
jgi:sterol desaturase/sphingolipid hydroxylase (fatty acid hydroxylase superfamily)